MSLMIGHGYAFGRHRVALLHIHPFKHLDKHTKDQRERTPPWPQGHRMFPTISRFTFLPLGEGSKENMALREKVREYLMKLEHTHSNQSLGPECMGTGRVRTAGGLAKVASLEIGYLAGTTTAYIYPSQIVPFYRIHSPIATAHYYTINETERDALLAAGGWEDEGITGYVLDWRSFLSTPNYQFTITALHRNRALVDRWVFWVKWRRKQTVVQ
ncbi:hypothetical protein B0H19DRAFT_1085183 [Mycena capillaripes]|nr:hypothetical protein B0H19DRAFT_1085183 [Mycena capillaripes]